ncbi:hypothetical protein [Flavobacterium sp.]|nr:hypothetical protein [Flavobacterium sp.]
MIKSISKEQVISKIKFENNWWVENSIDTDYKEMPRRNYFEIFGAMSGN